MSPSQVRQKLTRKPSMAGERRCRPASDLSLSAVERSRTPWMRERIAARLSRSSALSVVIGWKSLAWKRSSSVASSQLSKRCKYVPVDEAQSCLPPANEADVRSPATVIAQAPSRLLGPMELMPSSDEAALDGKSILSMRLPSCTTDWYSVSVLDSSVARRVVLEGMKDARSSLARFA